MMERGRTIIILWLADQIDALAEEEDSNRKSLNLFFPQKLKENTMVYLFFVNKRNRFKLSPECKTGSATTRKFPSHHTQSLEPQELTKAQGKNVPGTRC